jgi:cytochrome P450
MIGSHPEVQQKIYNEMQNLFGDDKQRIPTYQEYSEMKYLERVIKETLRIRPSVPSVSRKLTEDIELDGYKVPAGANVQLAIYFIHRDERYFKDPEKFDPDRFLPENTENRHPYAFVPFSAGPRNCIGQRFALLEEKAMLSSIVRSFKITSMQKLEDINLIQELVLRPHEGIVMKFEHRK